MAQILVINDGLIANMLRMEGYTIAESSGPLEALEVVSLKRGDIDLVLTDIATEPISGLVLATRLARLRTGIPVFFLAEPSIAKAIEGSLGKNGLIEKPFTAANLISSIGKFLAKMRRTGEAKPAEVAATTKVIRDNLPAPIRTVFRF